MCGFLLFFDQISFKWPVERCSLFPWHVSRAHNTFLLLSTKCVDWMNCLLFKSQKKKSFRKSVVSKVFTLILIYLYYSCWAKSWGFIQLNTEGRGWNTWVLQESFCVEGKMKTRGTCISHVLCECLSKDNDHALTIPLSAVVSFFNRLHFPVISYILRHILWMLYSVLEVLLFWWMTYFACWPPV